MQRFYLFLKFLRVRVPIKRKVIVRRIKMNDDGSTTLSNSEAIVVCINKDKSIPEQIDILIHEWGHVIEFDKMQIHGRQWGIGMAKAYETWEEFCRTKE